MNRVILMGRLTADPEMRQTPNGIAVARFNLAVNRRFSKEGQQQTDFINCIAWRKSADFLCRYFHKGNMVAVVGNIQTRSWDGQDGRKQYATEVIADEIYFTGEKTQNEYSQPFPSNNGSQMNNNSSQSGFDGFTEYQEESDLPF